MIRRSVILVFTLAIIGFLGISSQAFSQNYCYFDNWTSSADMGWWNNRIPNEYALSEAQINKLNDIRSADNEKIVPLQNELMVLKRNMQYYNTEIDSDVQKLKSDRKKVRKLEDKISDLNLDTQLGTKKVLTKEQLVYFNDGGYGWWNMAESCWYSGNTGMNSGKQMMMSRRSHCR